MTDKQTDKLSAHYS